MADELRPNGLGRETDRDTPDRRKTGRALMRASTGVMNAERAMELIPIWKDAGMVTLEPMLGGRTNSSYRVQVDDNTFVLRVNAVNGTLLGVDREREYEILKHVGRAEIGPQPIYIDKEAGVLVTSYIEGDVCTTEEVRKPVNIKRIVTALKKLHALPAPRHVMDLVDVVNRYCNVVIKSRMHFSPDVEAIRPRLLGMVREWARGTEQTCLCHNDLVHSNIIDGKGYQFIDWEYASTGDPMFELAALSQYHHYTERHTDYLLETYYGEASNALRHRMRKTQSVFDAVSILWVMAFRVSAGGSVRPQAGSEDLFLEHLERLADGGSPLRGRG